MVLDVAIEVPTTAVPDVLGMDGSTARELLEDAGLEAVIAEEAEAPPEVAATRAGKVWRQRPAAGRRVPQGSAVRLSVNPS